MQGELNIFISLTNFINMAKYIKKEIADLNGKGTTQAYYRLKTWRKLDSEEFAERCHSLHPSFSKGLISGVLDAVVDQLAYEISNGFSVKIDGLGTFSAKLGVRKDKEMDNFETGSKKLNAKSIEVTGVSLRVDKKLIKEIDRNCDLERGEEERLQTSKMSLEERIEKARQYLKKNGFMRVNDYAILTGLSYSTASRELRRLASDPTSGITSQGRRSSKLYILQA